MKQYQLIGPATNLSGELAGCPSCQGQGKRVQPGSVPEECSTCKGTGKIPGLLKQINDAATEGWVVVSSHPAGHPLGSAHVVIMEREKQ